MSRFIDLGDDTVELVNGIATFTGVDRYMTVVPMGVSSSKKLIEIKKCPPVGEYVAKRSEVLCVIIYEKAFDRLDEEQQKLLLLDAFNNVKYDEERDKVTIGVPQITITLEGRAKWGNTLVNAAESALHAISQIEDEEKALKEQEKENKKKNRKNKEY